MAQIQERRDELAKLAPWLPLFGEPRHNDDQTARPDNAQEFTNFAQGLLASLQSLDQIWPSKFKRRWSNFPIRLGQQRI